MQSTNMFNLSEEQSHTDQTLYAYPIPCNNFIYIASALNEEILIYDSIGKIVATHESRNSMFDTSHLKSGLYFIRSAANGVTIPFNVIH